MPAPLAVDKEAVRVLVVAVGVREAARQMELSENTVLAWANRGGWLQHAEAARDRAKQRSSAPVVQSTAITPAQAMENVLSDLSKRGKLAYLKAGVAVGEHAAQLAETDPDTALTEGQNVKAWAGTTALAAGWAEKAQSAQVMVSVALLGMQPDQLSTAQDQPFIDVEADPA